MLGVALDFENYPSTQTPINGTNLNNMQKLLVDLIYPVGTYYDTSDIDFDPNTAWGGTWELDQSGTVLVSKSSASSSKFNGDVNTVVGEEEHTLTTNEMPEHNHNLFASEGGSILFPPYSAKSDGDSGTVETGGYATITTYAGSNQPHNNVQPSKITNRWHRTA